MPPSPRILLDRSPQIDARNAHGRTALHFAAATSEKSVAVLLQVSERMWRSAACVPALPAPQTSLTDLRARRAIAQRGADWSVRDSNGQTALLGAKGKGQTQAAALLTAVWEKAETPVHGIAYVFTYGIFSPGVKFFYM